MVLVIALPDLARKLCKVLFDHQCITKVEDGKELRHVVHVHQPQIVVLDWRMGGSRWRALDEVTAIRERTATHPSVIAMLPKVTKDVKLEAAKLGCYDVVNVGVAGAARRVADSVELALQARLVKPVEIRRVSRDDLH